MTEPSIRKPVGVIAILGLITLLAVAVVALAPAIGEMHVAVQAIIYLVAGLVWIAPLGPCCAGWETGRFR